MGKLVMESVVTNICKTILRVSIGVGQRLFFSIYGKFPGHGDQSVCFVISISRSISPAVCHMQQQIPFMIPVIFHRMVCCIGHPKYMILIVRHCPGDPGSHLLIGWQRRAALHYVSRTVVRKAVNDAFCGSPLCHIVLSVVCVGKLISFGIHDPCHVVVAVVFKFCCLFLRIDHRNQMIVFIVGIRLSKLFPEQGQAVKKCHIGITAVRIGYLNAGVIILRHIYVTQELPVHDIRTEICVMHIFCFCSIQKDQFHTKPTILMVFCLWERNSASPGIDHISIAFLAGNLQCFGKFFIHFGVSEEPIDMFIQFSYALLDGYGLDSVKSQFCL